MARLGDAERALLSALLLVACGGSDPADLFVPSGGGGAAGATTGTGAGPGGGAGGSAAPDGDAGDGGAQADAGPSGTAGDPSQDAGGTAGAGGSAEPGNCATNDECGSTAYCAKVGCGADVRGRCTPRPDSCDDAESPVCGCDGITYFNACLAMAMRENVAEPAPCGATALACSPGGDTCGVRSGGFCAVMLDRADECPADTNARPTGKCWVLPESCPQYDVHFNSCDGNDTCVHTCDVAKAERPFYAEPGCH